MIDSVILALLKAAGYVPASEGSGIFCLSWSLSSATKSLLVYFPPPPALIECSGAISAIVSRLLTLRPARTSTAGAVFASVGAIGF